MLKSSVAQGGQAGITSHPRRYFVYQGCRRAMRALRLVCCNVALVRCPRVGGLERSILQTLASVILKGRTKNLTTENPMNEADGNIRRIYFAATDNVSLYMARSRYFLL